MNYADMNIQDQMIHGIVDPIIQEKVLSHVKNESSLKESITYIDTLEKAK